MRFWADAVVSEAELLVSLLAAPPVSPSHSPASAHPSPHLAGHRLADRDHRRGSPHEVHRQ